MQVKKIILPDQPNKKLFTAIPKPKTMLVSNDGFRNPFYFYVEWIRFQAQIYGRDRRFYEPYVLNQRSKEVYSRHKGRYQNMHRDYYVRVTRSKAGYKTTYRHHKWTAQDFNYLHANYGKMPARLIAEKIGVNTKALLKRARKLGLKGHIGRPKQPD